MKSKLTLILLAMLCLGPTKVSAQSHNEGTPDGKTDKLIQKWLKTTGDYIMGTPWNYTSPMPTTHVKLLGTIGYGGAKDTYLSELNHSGIVGGITLTMDFPRNYFHKYPAHLYQELGLDIGSYDNNVNTSIFSSMLVNYSIGLLPRWYENQHWSIDATLLYNINGGVIMKPSNTNNVVNAKVSTGLDAFGRLQYRTAVRNYPINLAYTAQLSLLHATFHPEYGQSYYEYISGDEKVMPKVHFTFPGKRTFFRQRLLIDLPIRHNTLTLGVEQQYHAEKMEHLSFKHVYWQAVVGYSFDFIRISGNKALRSNKLRNNYYSSRPSL